MANLISKQPCTRLLWSVLDRLSHCGYHWSHTIQLMVQCSMGHLCTACLQLVHLSSLYNFMFSALSLPWCHSCVALPLLFLYCKRQKAGWGLGNEATFR